MSLFGKRSSTGTFRNTATNSFRPLVEELEIRLVPYSATGNAWPQPELITLSFVPDGTIIGAGSGGLIYSNLFARFNAHTGWTTATWQNEIIRAAQSWAQQTNINFDIVADDGTETGLGDYQQGDPNYGDIRVGGYQSSGSWLASAYLPPPINNYSIAGDIIFNTNKSFNIGAHYDLFTVSAHEVGHALGLGHSTVAASEMFTVYNAIKPALNADDISGIRAIYSGGSARAADVYDAAASNNTFATATSLTIASDTALATGLDITTTSDVDYYSVVASSTTNGTLQVKVQTAGLSLLRQAVTIYAADQTTVLASGNSAGAYDGTTVSLSVSGVSASQTFYVKVAGADATAFGTGKYALTVNFGSGANPTVPLPDTQTPNGEVLSGGGGIYQAVNKLLRTLDQATAGYEMLGVSRELGGDGGHYHDDGEAERDHDGGGRNRGGRGFDLGYALRHGLQDVKSSGQRQFDVGAHGPAHGAAPRIVSALKDKDLGNSLQESLEDLARGDSAWLAALTELFGTLDEKSWSVW